MGRVQKGTTYQRGAGLKVWRRMPRAASRRGTNHLLDRWPWVQERLRAAKHVALFLDFDGTLTPIRRRPEDVWLDEATRRLLRRLSQHAGLTVVVISGRQYRDLTKRIRVPGLLYLGLHGLERKGKASFTSPGVKSLRRVGRLLAARLAGLPSIWVEDKRLSFVVHYRGATSATVQRARRILQETLNPLESVLRLLPGKKVWEILLQEAPDKGAAVLEVLKGLPPNTLPIYLGDDTTDESAFAVLRQGLTVRVGALRRSKARFRLRSPAEVKDFLERLEARIP